MNPSATALACALCALCAAAFCGTTAATDQVRGVAPGDQAAYGAGNTLLCEGVHAEHGAGRMVTAGVNDDYCDCQDGSDEPGTSACSHLLESTSTSSSSSSSSSSGAGGVREFYCVNRGSRPKTIFRSRVGDGICDCCDGTDEDEGACDNTCMEDGASWRAAMEQRLQTIRAGVEKRRDYAREALELTVEAETKQRVAAAALAEAQGKIAALEATRDDQEQMEVEDQKAAALAERHDVFEAFRLSEILADQPRTEDFLVGLLELAQGKGFLEDLASLISQQLPEDDREVPRAAGSEGAEQEQEQEQAKEVELNPDGSPVLYSPSGARLPPGAAPADGYSDSAAEEEEEEQEQQQSGTAGAEVESAEAGAAAEGTGEQAEAESTTSSRTLLLSALVDRLRGSVTRPEAEAAREALRLAREDVTTKERALKDLGDNETEAMESGKYGPDGAFRKLRDQCFSRAFQGYKYEMCFFGSAKQDHVRLGSWDATAWAENVFDDAGSAGKELVAKFTGGQSCWNGPMRSLTVHFTCGLEDEIRDVSEPSVCSYRMVFGTPLACTETELEQVSKELATV